MTMVWCSFNRTMSSSMARAKWSRARAAIGCSRTRVAAKLPNTSRIRFEIYRRFPIAPRPFDVGCSMLDVRCSRASAHDFLLQTLKLRHAPPGGLSLQPVALLAGARRGRPLADWVHEICNAHAWRDCRSAMGEGGRRERRGRRDHRLDRRVQGDQRHLPV